MSDAKAALRKAAALVRAEAQKSVDATALDAALRTALAPHRGLCLAGYLPIRSEADPRPAMAWWAARDPLCLPVVAGPARPLEFRSWRPGAPLETGAFGVEVPAAGALSIPDVLIVPLLAFDRAGYRLGYGGGFYDRTLAALRAEGRVVAIGLAYSAQEVAACPRDANDAPLDMIVTEAGPIDALE